MAIDPKYLDRLEQEEAERRAYYEKLSNGMIDSPFNPVTFNAKPIRPLDVLSPDMYEAYIRNGWDLYDLPTDLEKERYETFKNEYLKRMTKGFFSNAADAFVEFGETWKHLFGTDSIDSELTYYDDMNRIARGESTNEIYLDPSKNQRWQKAYIQQQIQGLGTSVGIVAEQAAELLVLKGVGKGLKALSSSTKLGNAGKYIEKAGKTIEGIGDKIAGTEKSFDRSKEISELVKTGRATKKNLQEIVGVGKVGRLGDIKNITKDFGRTMARGELEARRNAALNASYTQEEVFNDLVSQGVPEEEALEYAKEVAKNARDNELKWSRWMNMIQAGVYMGITNSQLKGWRKAIQNGTLSGIGKSKNNLSRIIENKFIKFGFDTLHEGFEEVIEDLQALNAKNEMYRNHKEELDAYGVNYMQNMDQLWDSFWGGALGGIVIGPGTRMLYKGYNKISGRTAKEEEEKKKYEQWEKDTKKNLQNGIRRELDIKQKLAKLDIDYNEHNDINDVSFSEESKTSYDEEYKKEKSRLEGELSDKAWLNDNIDTFITAIRMNTSSDVNSESDYTGEMISTSQRMLSEIDDMEEIINNNSELFSKLWRINEIDKDINRSRSQGGNVDELTNEREQLVQSLSEDERGNLQSLLGAFNDMEVIGIVGKIDQLPVFLKEKADQYRKKQENFIAMATSVAEDFMTYYHAYNNNVNNAIRYATLRAQARINEIYQDYTDEQIMKDAEKIIGEFVNVSGNDYLFGSFDYDKNTGTRETDVAKKDNKNIRKQRVFFLEFLKGINKDGTYDDLIERLESIIARDANMDLRRNTDGSFDKNSTSMSYTERYESGFRNRTAILGLRKNTKFNNMIDESSKKILSEYEGYRQEFINSKFNDFTALNEFLDGIHPFISLYHELIGKVDKNGNVSISSVEDTDTWINSLTVEQIEYLIKAASEGMDSFKKAIDNISNTDKDVFEKIISENNRRIEEIRKEYLELVEKSTKYDITISELRKELSDRKDELDKLIDDDASKSDIDKKNNEINTINKKIEDIEKDIANNKNERDKLDLSIDEIQSKNKIYESVQKDSKTIGEIREEAVSEINPLREKISELEGKISTQGAKLSSANKKIEEAVKKELKKKLEKEKEQLQKDSVDLSDEELKLRNEKIDYINRTIKGEDTKSVRYAYLKGTERTSFRKKIQKISNDIYKEQKEKFFNKPADELERLHKELRPLKEKLNELETRIDIGKNKIEEIERHIEERSTSSKEGPYSWAYEKQFDKNHIPVATFYRITQKLASSITKAYEANNSVDRLYKMAGMMTSRFSGVIGLIDDMCNDVAMEITGAGVSVFRNKMAVKKFENTQRQLKAWMEHYRKNGNHDMADIIYEKILNLEALRMVVYTSYENAKRSRENAKKQAKLAKEERKRKNTAKTENKNKDKKDADNDVPEDNEEQDEHIQQDDEEPDNEALAGSAFSKVLSRVDIPQEVADASEKINRSLNEYTPISTEYFERYNILIGENDQKMMECYDAKKWVVTQDIDSEDDVNIGGTKFFVYNATKVIKKGTEVILAIHKDDNGNIFGTIQLEPEDIQEENTVDDQLSNIEAEIRAHRNKQRKNKENEENNEILKKVFDIISSSNMNFLGSFDEDTKNKLIEMGLTESDIRFISTVFSAMYTYTSDCDKIEDVADKMFSTKYLGLSSSNPKWMMLFKMFVEMKYGNEKDLYKVISDIAKFHEKTIVIQGTTNNGDIRAYDKGKNYRQKGLSDKDYKERGMTIEDDRALKSNDKYNMVQYFSITNGKVLSKVKYKGESAITDKGFDSLIGLKEGDTVTTGIVYDIEDDESVIRLIEDQFDYDENGTNFFIRSLIKEGIISKENGKKDIERIYSGLNEEEKQKVFELYVSYAVIPLKDKDGNIVGFMPNELYYDETNVKGYDKDDNGKYSYNKKAHLERIKNLNEQSLEMRRKALKDGFSIKIKENKRHSYIYNGGDNESIRERVDEAERLDTGKYVFPKDSSNDEYDRIGLRSGTDLLYKGDEEKGEEDSTETVMNTFYPEIVGVQRKNPKNGNVEYMYSGNMDDDYDISKSEAKPIYDHAVTKLKMLFVSYLSNVIKNEKNELVKDRVDTVMKFIKANESVRNLLGIGDVYNINTVIERITKYSNNFASDVETFLNTFFLKRWKASPNKGKSNISRENGMKVLKNSKYSSRLALIPEEMIEGSKEYATSSKKGRYYLTICTSNEDSDENIITDNNIIDINPNDLDVNDIERVFGLMLGDDTLNLLKKSTVDFSVFSEKDKKKNSNILTDLLDGIDEDYWKGESENIWKSENRNLQGVLSDCVKIPNPVKLGNTKTIYPEILITFEEDTDSTGEQDSGENISNADDYGSFDYNPQKGKLKTDGKEENKQPKTETEQKTNNEGKTDSKRISNVDKLLNKHLNKHSKKTSSRVITTATDKTNPDVIKLPSIDENYLIQGFTVEQQYILCKSIVNKVLSKKNILSDITYNGMNIRKIVVECINELKSFIHDDNYKEQREEMLAIGAYLVISEKDVITKKGKLTQRTEKFDEALKKHGLLGYKDDIEKFIEKFDKKDIDEIINDVQKSPDEFLNEFERRRDYADTCEALANNNTINKLFTKKEVGDGKVIIGTMQVVLRDMLKENVTIEEAEDIENIIENPENERYNDFITGHNESYETPVIDTYSMKLRCVLSTIKKSDEETKKGHMIQSESGLSEYENVEYVINFLRSIGSRCGYTWNDMLKELEKEVNNNTDYSHIARQIISLFGSKDIVDRQLRQELMHKIICSEVGFTYLFDSEKGGFHHVEIESDIVAQSVTSRRKDMINHVRCLPLVKSENAKDGKHIYYIDKDKINDIKEELDNIYNNGNVGKSIKAIKIQKVLNTIYGYKFNINTIIYYKYTFDTLIEEIRNFIDYFDGDIPLYYETTRTRNNTGSVRNQIAFMNNIKTASKRFNFASLLHDALEFDAMYNIRGFEAQVIKNGKNCQSTTGRSFPDKQIIDLYDEKSEYGEYVRSRYIESVGDTKTYQYPQLVAIGEHKADMRIKKGFVSIGAYVNYYGTSEKITKTSALTNIALETNYHLSCKGPIHRQIMNIKKFGTKEIYSTELGIRDGYIFDFTNSNKQKQSWVKMPKIVPQKNASINNIVEYMCCVIFDNELIRIEELKRSGLFKSNGEHILGCMPEMNTIRFKIGDTEYDLETFLRTSDNLDPLKEKRLLNSLRNEAKKIIINHINNELQDIVGNGDKRELISKDGFVDITVDDLKGSNWEKANVISIDDNGNITLRTFQNSRYDSYYEKVYGEREDEGSYEEYDDDVMDDAVESTRTTDTNFIGFASLDMVINNLLGKEFLIQTMYGGWSNYFKGYKEGDFVKAGIEGKSRLIKSLFYETGRNLNKRFSGIYSEGRNMDFSQMGDSLHKRGNDWGGVKHDKFNYLMLAETEHSSVYAKSYIELHYAQKYAENKDKTDLLLKILINGYNPTSDEKEKIGLKKNDKISKKGVSKILKGMYPNIADYFWINSTDGAEWCTWREFLDCIFVEGKMSEEEYKEKNRIFEKLSKGEDLSPDELLTISSAMNAKKPVYFGQNFRKDDNGNIKAADTLFVKSAMMPLLPQFTKGTELDNVRKLLEGYEKKEKKNCHLTFMSAVKVGHPQNEGLTLEKMREYAVRCGADENASIEISDEIREELMTSTIEGDRKYFVIQQETENHLDKNIEKSNNRLSSQVLDKLNEIIGTSDTITDASIKAASLLKVLSDNGIEIRKDKEKGNTKQVEKNISAIVAVLAAKFARESTEIRNLYKNAGNDKIEQQNIGNEVYNQINSNFVTINSKGKVFYDIKNFEDNFKKYCSQYGITDFNKNDIDKLKDIFKEANDNDDSVNILEFDINAEDKISESELMALGIIDSLSSVDAYTVEATQMAHLFLSSGINRIEEYIFDIDPKIIFQDVEKGIMNDEVMSLLGNKVNDKEFVNNLKKGKCNGHTLDVMYTYITSKHRIAAMNDLYTELGLIDADKVAENRYGNVYIDFEDMKINDNERYMAFIKNLRRIIMKQLNERGASTNVIKQLGLNASGDFSVPLFFSISSDKIMLLLNSIINRRISKSFLPGTSMYTTNSEDLIRVTSDARADKAGQMIWLDNTRGDRRLRPSRIISGKNEKIVEPAEVAITSQFTFFNKETRKYERINLYSTDNDNNLIYLTGYKGAKIRRSSNGNIERFDEKTKSWVENSEGVFLNKNMIDESLLDVMSLRIPTSGHMSGVAVKVVAILPPSCGDMIIVPEENMAQLGEDFDIDKRFVYMKNYHYDPITKRIMVVDNNFVALEEKRCSDNIASIRREIRNIKNEKKKASKEEKSSLSEQIKTKNIQLEEMAKYMDKLKKQLRENRILDMYLTVFNCPNEDIQRAITSTLGTEVIDNTKEMIIEKTNIEASDDEMQPSICSMKYQRDLRTSAADGGLGVGVHSINVVFSSLLQKHNVNIKRRVMTKNGAKYVPIKIAIDGIKSNGNISDPRCISRNGKESRLKQSVNAAGQNICLDTVKKDDIAFINQNRMTINFFTMMSNLGFDTASQFRMITQDGIMGKVYGKEIGIDLASMICVQPIILSYAKEFDDNRTDTKMKMSRISVMENILKNVGLTDEEISYIKTNGNFDKKNRPGNVREFVCEFYLEGDKLRYINDLDMGDISSSDLYRNISKNIKELNDDDIHMQLKILSFFNGIEELSSGLSDYKKIVNASAQGVGKYFLSVRDKINALNNMGKDNIYNGISELIGIFKKKSGEDPAKMREQGYFDIDGCEYYIKPTTAEGHTLLLSLKAESDIVGNGLNYNRAPLKRVFDLAEDYFNEMGMYESQKDQMRRRLVNDIRNYIYCYMGTLSLKRIGGRIVYGLWDGSVSDERKRLIVSGREVNVQPLITQEKPQLETTQIADIIATLKYNEIPGIVDNAFLQQFDIQEDGTIKFVRNSNSISDREFEESFTELYNSTEPLKIKKKHGEVEILDADGNRICGRDIALDLITYAFIADDKKGIADWRSLIPQEVLEGLGFYDILWNIMDNLDEYFIPENMFQQFIENNAKELTMTIDANELKKERDNRVRFDTTFVDYNTTKMIIGGSQEAVDAFVSKYGLYPESDGNSVRDANIKRNFCIYDKGKRLRVLCTYSGTNKHNGTVEYIFNVKQINNRRQSGKNTYDPDVFFDTSDSVKQRRKAANMYNGSKTESVTGTENTCEKIKSLISTHSASKILNPILDNLSEISWIREISLYNSNNISDYQSLYSDINPGENSYVYINNRQKHGMNGAIFLSNDVLNGSGSDKICTGVVVEETIHMLTTQYIENFYIEDSDGNITINPNSGIKNNPFKNSIMAFRVMKKEYAKIMDVLKNGTEEQKNEIREKYTITDKDGKEHFIFNVKENRYSPQFEHIFSEGSEVDQFKEFVAAGFTMDDTFMKFVSEVENSTSAKNTIESIYKSICELIKNIIDEINRIIGNDDNKTIKIVQAETTKMLRDIYLDNKKQNELIKPMLVKWEHINLTHEEIADKLLSESIKNEKLKEKGDKKWTEAISPTGDKKSELIETKKGHTTIGDECDEYLRWVVDELMDKDDDITSIQKKAINDDKHKVPQILVDTENGTDYSNLNIVLRQLFDFRNKFGRGGFRFIGTNLALLSSPKFKDNNGKTVRIKGYPDFVLIDRFGGVHIIDLKTRKSEKIFGAKESAVLSRNEDKNETLRQQAFYKELIFDVLGIGYNKIKNYIFEINYDRENKYTGSKIFDITETLKDNFSIENDMIPIRDDNSEHRYKKSVRFSTIDSNNTSSNKLHSMVKC